MPLPGWYPDPSGQPQTFRYWDGQAWSVETTQDPRQAPPAAPAGQPGPAQPGPAPFGQPGAPGQPVTPGRQGAPGRQGEPGQQGQVPAPRRRALPVVVTAAVLAVVVGLGAVQLGPALWGGAEPSRPPASPRPVPAPTGATTAGGPTPGGGAPNCAGGNGVNQRDSSPTRSAAGLQFDSVPDWRWSFSRDLFPWVDDLSAYGEAKKYGDPSIAAGIILGGLARKNGFADPQQAVGQVVQCIERYGIGKDGDYDFGSPGAPTASTLGGLPGFHVAFPVKVKASGKSMDLQVWVIDAGTGTGFAMVHTFAPTDDPDAHAKIDTALKTLRRS